ncbi:LysR substrate-binding domain-containing protein [Mesorhizobium sp. 10J20-29]
MRFQHFDSLRVFNVVARHESFSSAADELNLTKGAVSYQLRVLEEALGFNLFDRKPRGIVLTPKGRELWICSMRSLDAIEARIDELRDAPRAPITIATTTYFASRWLSPRLMMFMKGHPRVRLRLQPMIDLKDLDNEGVDLAIRWGRGDSADSVTQRLFACPAFATGSADALALVQAEGLASAVSTLTLLADRSGSAAWEDWHRVAGLPFKARDAVLTIPDPNLRVQAVIDGQGIALNDALVETEMERGSLFRLSQHQIEGYGYFLVHRADAMSNPDVADFARWVLSLES